MNENYQKILNKLNSEYGKIEKGFGPTVFKLSKDGFLYLRYSKKKVIGVKKQKDRYFFGIEVDTIEKFKNLEFSIVFVCGDDSQVIVLNKDVFYYIIEDAPINRNQWKINLFIFDGTCKLMVTGKPKIDITEHLNNYSNIFTKTIYKEIHNFPAVENRKREVEKSEIEILKNNINVNSLKSNKPVLFEKTILDYFKFIGFDCEHIGGAGNTDVLIKEPFRVIVEVKTTTKEKINRIYFTRLKQHKKKHEADYIAVIAYDFENAVIKDAEMENALLIKTDTLCSLIDIFNQYPFSSSELEYMFQLKGILDKDNLNRISENQAFIKNSISLLSLIIQSIDNNKRNIDEIYGRFQMKCLESNSVFDDRNTFHFLIEILTNPILKIIKKDKNHYFREIPENMALKKLKNFGGFVYESIN